MGREQNLVGASARQVKFSIGKRARGERRVDEHFILAVRPIRKLSMSDAEAPMRLVVSRAIRNEIGTIRKRE